MATYLGNIRTTRAPIHSSIHQKDSSVKPCQTPTVPMKVTGFIQFSKPHPLPHRSFPLDPSQQGRSRRGQRLQSSSQGGSIQRDTPPKGGFQGLFTMESDTTWASMGVSSLFFKMHWKKNWSLEQVWNTGDESNTGEGFSHQNIRFRLDVSHQHV